MAKKRKFNPKATEPQKHLPVEVIIEDVTTHPLCLHGPTLLFSSEKGRYFACASCRDKKDCTLHIEEDEWKKEGVRKRNEKYYSLIPKIDKAAAWSNLNEIKSRHSSDRAYCDTCKELYILSQSKKHLKDHRVITPLTDEQLQHPSSWLPALENDTVEAQYIFNKKSVSCVLGILKNNNIKNILCIGTPSIHEAAQAHPDFNSLLLDYDTRQRLFHHPNKYLWYNMFNNYLLNGNDDEKVLKKFFKNSKDGGICVVMDPPFGGRVEPLTHTLKELSATYSRLTDQPNNTIPVIWAFPYFSEPYIRNIMPEIKMHDFQVEYENHKKFQRKAKKGSPVRFFTNLPLATIDMSNDSNYKLCNKCKYWVLASNNHCNKCGECTSKNGMRYKHCSKCERCVKPTYSHCVTCGRCCLEKHVCGLVVESQDQEGVTENEVSEQEIPAAIDTAEEVNIHAIDTAEEVNIHAIDTAEEVNIHAIDTAEDVNIQNVYLVTEPIATDLVHTQPDTHNAIILQKIDNLTNISTQLQNNLQNVLQKLASVTTLLEEYIKKITFKEMTNATSTNFKAISDVKMLQEFESSLENPDLKQELMKKLSIICSKGKGRGINNAYVLVDVMFTRKLMTECSWAGGTRKDNPKSCFKSYTHTINLFFEIIHDSDKDFTKTECDNFFKNVLRHSVARNSSRQLRCSAAKRRPRKNNSTKDEKTTCQKNNGGGTSNPTARPSTCRSVAEVDKENVDPVARNPQSSTSQSVD